MSMIICTTPTETGAYPVESQSHRAYPENWNGAGWLAVPPALEDKCRSLMPWGKPVIKKGEIVEIQMVEHTAPEPVVRPEEQLRADVDFIAAMTGVEL